MSPRADLLHAEEELLDREQSRVRHELQYAFSDLGREISNTLGLRRQIERHPWLYLSSAAAAGLALGGPVRRLLFARRLGRGLFLSLLAFSARNGIASLLSGWLPSSSTPDLFRTYGWLRDRIGPLQVRKEFSRNH